MTRLRSESGFSLVELLVATGLLLVVSSIVTSALLQMTKHQQTIWNRTEMHSGVRGATELLQQEVGQAGRITLPAPVTLDRAAVSRRRSRCTRARPSTVVGQLDGRHVRSPAAGWLTSLTMLDGDNAGDGRRSASITSATTITACFTNDARRRRRPSSRARRLRDRHRAADRHRERLERATISSCSATSTATARWCTSSTSATTATSGTSGSTISIAT